MSMSELGFLLLVFIASAALVMLIGQLIGQFAGSGAAKERARRLVTQGDTLQPTPRRWIELLASGTQSLSRFSESGTEAQNSALRRRLLQAGIRSAAAPTAYFGTKTLLAVTLPLLLFATHAFVPGLLEEDVLLYALVALASLGYYLPNLVLSQLIRLRQRELFENFPDALDLMTVCVEAGLGIEAALQRVAEDVRHKSRVLSEELQLVGLELRAGAPRERALHNLALRTAVEEVDGFVSMLVQAERFGTSIAQTLRVHADMLRTRRRQRAEEAAAKIGIKLLLPLAFCIFPALMLVLMGPSMISIYRILSTVTGGDGL